MITEEDYDWLVKQLHSDNVFLSTLVARDRKDKVNQELLGIQKDINIAIAMLRLLKAEEGKGV